VNEQKTGSVLSLPQYSKSTPLLLRGRIYSLFLQVQYIQFNSFCKDPQMTCTHGGIRLIYSPKITGAFLASIVWRISPYNINVAGVVIVKYSTTTHNYRSSTEIIIFQCCGFGSALILFGWIRIQIQVGKTDPQKKIKVNFFVLRDPLIVLL
jgi:hypothetical protein